MSILIYKNASFESIFPQYNLSETLVFSTSNMRYRSSYAFVMQCQEKECSDIFKSGLDTHYADTIIIDLFDEWVKKAPKAVGAFLDDYDDGLFPDSQLLLVIEDESLIDTWELENVIKDF